MRLSQDIIFHQLSTAYPLGYAKKADCGKTYTRPAIFAEGMDLAGTVVVCRAGELLGSMLTATGRNDCLVICVDKLLDKHPSQLAKVDFPVVTLKSEVLPVEVYNKLQSIFDLFLAWDQELASNVLEAKGFSDLIDSCAMVTNSPITIIDNMGNYVAFNNPYYESIILPEKRGEETSVPWKYAGDFSVRKVFPEFTATKGALKFTFDDTNLDVVNIFVFNNDQFVGGMGAVLEKNEDYGYLAFIIEHLNYYVERLFDRFKSFGNIVSKNSSLSTLLENMLEGRDIPEERWVEAYAETGWGEGDSLQLVQLKTNPQLSQRELGGSLSVEIEHIWKGVISFSYSDQNLLIINHEHFQSHDHMDFYQAFANLLRDNLLIAGLSRRFYNPAHLPFAYQQTLVALSIGAEKSPTSWYYEFDDFVLSYITRNSSGSLGGEHVCSSKLLTLKKHDEIKNTDYYRTLLTYFQCMFSATETARKLFIQRSSLVYRMERIQKLVQIDFSSFDEIQYLFSSFGILEEG